MLSGENSLPSSVIAFFNDKLLLPLPYTLNDALIEKIYNLFAVINVVDSFRIIQKFLSNYAEYYPWKRRTLGIGASTMRTW